MEGGDFEGLGSGWHTVGLLRETDRIQWIFDGSVVLEITDPARIPDIYQYLIISREMTNGFIEGDAVYDGGGYFLPPEGGLYGYGGKSDIGAHLDRINDDKALIDYVRIYAPGG